MKKYLSLIAVLALLVACMIPAVSAADINYAIGSTELEMNQGVVEVKLPVTTVDNGIAAGDFSGITVSGDAELVGVKSGDISATYNKNNGKGALLNLDGEDVKGTLFYIVVKVPTDKAATFTVSIANATATSVDAGLTMANVAVASGTITITHTCVAGEWETVKEATCTETGLMVKKCTLCGIVLEEKVIDKLAHTEEVIPGKAATCTEAGLTDGLKCSVCGEILKAQEEIAALGHAWDEGVVGNEDAYDCPDEFLIQTCANCKETKEVENGHECDESKAITHTVSNVYDEEKKVNIATIEYRCEHSLESAHGCSTVFKTETKEIEDPKTGDITPYIAMGVLTLVAMVSAAGYMLLKRKAI